MNTKFIEIYRYFFYILYVYAFLEKRRWGVHVSVCMGGWMGEVFIFGYGPVENWHTVDWKVTYAGLKSDVWAKMQHCSVIVFGYSYCRVLRNKFYHAIIAN